jgi:hypothetical protein
VYPQQTIPRDPSLPPTPDIAELYPGYYCDCRAPVAIDGIKRKGVAVTYCARCEREVSG